VCYPFCRKYGRHRAVRRREFITLLGGAAAWPLAARAQQPARPYRVAYLALLAGRDSVVVKQRLDELGYIEGKNMIFDFRSAEGRSERLLQLASELVRTSPDVIVAGFGTLAAQAAQAATETIPIVFASVGDPIGAGIVKSLNRPGANVTGITPQGTETGGKRLQMLEELVPGIRILAVLMNPETPFSMLALQELRVAADAGGQRLEVFEIRSTDQLSHIIEFTARSGATGLVILEDPLLLGLRRQITELATELRLPAIYGNREFAEAGGLLSYGPDRGQLYRRAAELIDKILKGAKPADIPVERPTKFELVINVKTARALGLTVPDKLLALADEVIE
jgi:putative tryptophan/tyrosine transport system substrate-binding protein